MKKRFDKIYIEITNSCNLNCNFCFNTTRPKQNMTLAEFKRATEQVKDYTDLALLHVKGEPLISPYLRDILEECKQNNIKVNITTNGTLLNKQKDILINSNAVRQINISLHSYIQNEDIKEDYLEEILNTVKEITEKTNIIVSYRLWNLEELESNNHNIEILKALEKEYSIRDLMKLASQKKSVQLTKTVFLNQDIQFTWPSMQGEQINQEGKCYGLRKQIAILVNGDVVPCCLDGEGELVLGNIYDQTLEEILETKRVKDMIQGFEQGRLIEPLCKTCGFIKRINK